MCPERVPGLVTLARYLEPPPGNVLCQQTRPLVPVHSLRVDPPNRITLGGFSKPESRCCGGHLMWFGTGSCTYCIHIVCINLQLKPPKAPERSPPGGRDTAARLLRVTAGESRTMRGFFKLWAHPYTCVPAHYAPVHSSLVQEVE